MRVQSGRTVIDIDPATGGIVRIADATGRVHFDAADHGLLFRVMAPTADWSSHHADSDLSSAEVEPDGDEIVIRYRTVVSPRWVSGIRAEARIKPTDNDEVVLSLIVHNDSEQALTDVLFPWLGGWRPGARRSELILGGVRSVDPCAYPKNRGITLGRWHQRDYWTYPRDLYCPWLDLGDPVDGVGLISYQTRPSILGVFVENLSGYGPGLDLSVGMTSFPYIKPGESWASPRFGISVHEGGWRSTADRYLAWVDTWLVRPPTPNWARRAIGVQNVLFTAQDGTPFRSYAEIPAVAEAGLRHGVPHLTVWDGPISGPDPAFFAPWLAATPPNRRALRSGLKSARSKGAHLSLIQNYRIVWPGSDFYRDVASREIALRLDGTPYTEEYEYSGWHGMFEAQHVGPMIHTLDPRAPGYRERVLAQVRSSLQDGFDSLHWDQPHMHWPSYREDTEGAQPYDVHTATVELVQEVRSLMSELDGEAMLLGEWGDVFGSAAIDMWMSWAEDIADIERAAYALPQAIWSCVVDSDPSVATRAFGFGAQLFLTTHGLSASVDAEPAFAEHVGRLARLKARSQDRIAFGRYRGLEGIASIDTSGVTAGVMQAPSGSCVILAAPADGGEIEVEIDPALLAQSPPRAGRLIRSDGSESEHRGDRMRVSLAPNEAAVWLI